MKDAYYFPHDSNAKDDPKCIQLIEEYGPEGYGIFWILIETLRSQTDYMAPMSILNGMARRYNTTAEKMRNVVLRFGLFEVTDDDQFFYSEAFLRRMQIIDSKRKKLSEAGKKGNSIRWESPPNRQAIATQSQVKERKENKSKEKENIENTHTHVTPTIEQCKQVAEMAGHDPMYGEAYFHLRDADGWCKPRGKGENMVMIPIANWRSDYVNMYNQGYLKLKGDNWGF